MTERLLVAALRIGQHRFAGRCSATTHRCVFCGLSVDLSGSRAAQMLVAQPHQAVASEQHAERLDARNGLAACPTHDVDTGLMTVNGGLRIHLKPALAAAARADPATRAAFGRPPLAEWLLLPDAASPPQERYLWWHHQHASVRSSRRPRPAGMSRLARCKRGTGPC